MHANFELIINGNHKSSMNRFTITVLILLWALLYSFCWNCYRKPECSGVEVVAEHVIPADSLAPADSLIAPPDTSEKTLTAEEELLFNPIDVYFPPASTDFTHSAEIDTFLVTAKRYLEEKPGEKLILTGFSDSDGSEELNVRLSENRASAVRRVLVKGGFKADQIEILGKGEADPLAPNDTPENKAKNRRVSLRLKN